MKLTQQLADRWDKRRTAVVRPPPPPPVVPVEHWGLLTEKEAGRIREFRAFWQLISVADYFARGYFNRCEWAEWDFLEKKLIADPVKLPVEGCERWAELGELEPVWRRHQRGQWWYRHAHRLKAVERRELPVWPELKPNDSEPVSVISAADYGWLPTPAVDEAFIAHIKQVMAWERKMSGQEDDALPRDRPLDRQQRRRAPLVDLNDSDDVSTPSDRDAERPADGRAGRQRAESPGEPQQAEKAWREKRAQQFLEGDEGWQTLRQF